MAALLTQAHAWDAGAGRGGDGCGDGVQGIGAPVIGSWPIRWTPSRRRLAVSPISRSAGRFVGRFPIPKSSVSVMGVSVRGAFPYCLIVVGCRPRAGSG